MGRGPWILIYPKIDRNIKQIETFSETKTLKSVKRWNWNQKQSFGGVLQKRYSWKFKNFSEKYLCWSQESLVKTIPCEFCGIFRNIYFVEHLWKHTCLKWSNDKIYWHKYIHRKPRWSCPLKYSYRFKGLQHGCLQFYLKGTQSQILSCKTCEVLQSFSFSQHYLLLGKCFWFPAAFLMYRFLHQQYINSITANYLETPDIVTCKWSRIINSKNL